MAMCGGLLTLVGHTEPRTFLCAGMSLGSDGAQLGSP